ncbi:MAG: argininosuccinate lyase [Sphingomonadales bacterium BRH_c3]|nr:MAG: argininosuccinate lyase [Sphingomonadales bacterium BRH_c3]
MRARFPIAVLMCCLALAACGKRTNLEPAAGQTLPPAPYGSETAPEAEELLEMETLAAPKRSVELRRRSEERQDDPFDLPPE